MRNPSGNLEFYYCKKSLPVMFRYRLSMLKYLLNRKKYPLFFVGNAKGGIIPSHRLLVKMDSRKFVRFKGHFYFSVNAPRWPSKAFDHMAANGGLNIAAAGTPFKKQMENAILGITGKCDYACVHCYEHFNLIKKGDILPVHRLQEVISQLQKNGVNVITLSGGEPMLRFDDAVTLLRTADHSLCDFHIHTSGYGVTPEKALILKEAGLVAAGIGLDDHHPERHDAFRRYKGAHQQAVKAVSCFLAAGIFTYINTCLTKELIRSGDLSGYFDFVKSLGVGFVRWLEPKPCGAYLDHEGSALPDEHDRRVVREFFTEANTSPRYHDYPVISYEAYSELPENLGCIMGGNSLLYIDSAGNVLPCVFLPVTFGNILTEDFNTILARMRNAIPAPLRSGCPSVALSHLLRSLKEEGISFPVPFDNIRPAYLSLTAVHFSM